MAKKNTKRNAEQQEFHLTPRQEAAVEECCARFDEVIATPRLNVIREGASTSISSDHADERIGKILLMAAIGTGDVNFLDDLLIQLADVVSTGGDVNERRLNFLASVIKDVKPRDQIEAMLAAQMAAVHGATMELAGLLMRAKQWESIDTAERTFSKLARTFTSQIEALKRYRTGGEQKVTVQHVSVSEGSQAIVGNVTHSPRETARDSASPSARPALTDSPTPAMNLVSETIHTPAPVTRQRK